MTDEQGKNPKASKLRQNPWFPPEWEIADASALQALNAGTASPDMQRRALKYVIESLAGTYDMSFRPGGEEGRRNTDFAEGRRFVGSQIVKLLHVNLATLRRKRNSDPAEPQS